MTTANTRRSDSALLARLIKSAWVQRNETQATFTPTGNLGALLREAPPNTVVDALNVLGVVKGVRKGAWIDLNGWRPPVDEKDTAVAVVHIAEPRKNNDYHQQVGTVVASGLDAQQVADLVYAYFDEVDASKTLPRERWGSKMQKKMGVLFGYLQPFDGMRRDKRGFVWTVETRVFWNAGPPEGALLYNQGVRNVGHKVLGAMQDLARAWNDLLHKVAPASAGMRCSVALIA